MEHDSLNAEYVALYWHRLGLVFSIIATASGIGITMIAGAGAYWHKWAVRQHKDRIDSMKQRVQ